MAEGEFAQMEGRGEEKKRSAVGDEDGGLFLRSRKFRKFELISRLFLVTCRRLSFSCTVIAIFYPWIQNISR